MLGRFVRSHPVVVIGAIIATASIVCFACFAWMRHKATIDQISLDYLRNHARLSLSRSTRVLKYDDSSSRTPGYIQWKLASLAPIDWPGDAASTPIPIDDNPLFVIKIFELPAEIRVRRAVSIEWRTRDKSYRALEVVTNDTYYYMIEKWDL